MIWVWAVLLVVAIGAIAVLVAGRNDAMIDVYDDRPDATLPTGRPLTPEDLEAVRLSTAVRGYRMDEVDALLDRLAADLRARQAPAGADPPGASALVEPRRPADFPAVNRHRREAASFEPQAPVETGDFPER